MSEQFNPNDWLTTAEAASMTGYKQKSISANIRRGNIPAVKKGKTWFVRRSDILEYAERMKALGSQKHTPKEFRQDTDSIN